MKKFRGCQFGPMQLRTVLRLNCERGERLIGWSTGRIEAQQAMQFMIHTLMHIGGAQILALMMMARLARFIVLTDRRLILLRVGRTSYKRAEMLTVLPLESVEISGGKASSARNGARHFHAVNEGKKFGLQVDVRKNSRPGQRLVRGLMLLASNTV